MKSIIKFNYHSCYTCRYIYIVFTHAPQAKDGLHYESFEIPRFTWTNKTTSIYSGGDLGSLWPGVWEAFKRCVHVIIAADGSRQLVHEPHTRACCTLCLFVLRPCLWARDIRSRKLRRARVLWNSFLFYLFVFRWLGGEGVITWLLLRLVTRPSVGKG